MSSNSEPRISKFCKSLSPLSRILEQEDYFVWGTSPIDGPDGRAAYMFAAFKGGKYDTASAAVLKIKDNSY